MTDQPEKTSPEHTPRDHQAETADDIANEITAAARAARDTAARAKGAPHPGEGRKWPLGRIGIGIGSAALAAAVIYAARRNKD